MLHTVDEEESFFPRLRASLTPEELAYVDGLESQHQDVDTVYTSLKEIVLELQQLRTPARVEMYRACVAKLAAAYRAHIASEDSILMEMGDESSALPSYPRSTTRCALAADEIR